MTIEEAQARLPHLIAAVAEGSEVVVVREDGAAFQIVRTEGTRRPRFGSARGKFVMSDDFDAPLEDFHPYERSGSSEEPRGE